MFAATPARRSAEAAPGPGRIVTLNVSGQRFQTFEETLARFPTTLLGDPQKRLLYYAESSGEYFFDRHRASFKAILYFYQSGGKLRRPPHIPLDVFSTELELFEMDKEIMEGFWASEGYVKPGEPPMPTNKWQRLIWRLVEYPDTGKAARVLAFVSIAIIFISIVSFCLETLPQFRILTSGSEMNPFFAIELGCMIWFTVEFLLRFMSCPSKIQFLKSFLNIIDILAISPFYINLFWRSSSDAFSFTVLRVLRLVRVFRIFKLSRYSVGLQVLGKTFAASVHELGLLVFFMAIVLVLFSSAVYFAESGVEGSQFTSIPTAFWFTIVTMTTVGYGDLVPVGALGKVVGSGCAVVGVLVLALPVPVIVSNFNHFYRQETQLAKVKAIQAESTTPVAVADAASAEEESAAQ